MVAVQIPYYILSSLKVGYW